MICNICSEEDGKTFTSREMMYGTRDLFEYFQCKNCGCVQLLKLPKNMNNYYHEDYFSLIHSEILRNPIKRFLAAKKANFEIFEKGVLGRIVCKIRNKNLALWALRKTPITLNSKILDVGCGTGNFLINLKRAGLRNLTGIDPYIKEDIIYSSNFKILKREIIDVEDSFDIITFNHSFEHILNQRETLRTVHKLLNDNGTCILRIPVASSYAFEVYGTNWVQLDPPRHLFLHSVTSLKILLQKTNLKLTNITYDSSEFQFWGSEQYKRNIPLNSEKSYKVNPKASIFSKKEINQFKRKAIELNKNKKGDQAAFYIKKQ